MSTINHQTGLPYLANSVLGQYSHTPDPGPMTAEQMIDAWRDLHAAGISVQTGSTWKTSDDEKDECTFSFVDTNDEDFDEVASAQDVDPLKAFAMAYSIYSKYRQAQSR